jgi:hypothetical protein
MTDVVTADMRLIPAAYCIGRFNNIINSGVNITAYYMQLIQHMIYIFNFLLKYIELLFKLLVKSHNYETMSVKEIMNNKVYKL